MDVEALKQQLRDEGFAHIYEWEDEPGTRYDVHAHQGRVKLVVLEGSFAGTVGGETKEYGVGDVFEPKPGEPHSAVVGQEGAKYLVAEEIEGDS